MNVLDHFMTRPFLLVVCPFLFEDCLRLKTLKSCLKTPCQRPDHRHSATIWGLSTWRADRIRSRPGNFSVATESRIRDLDQHYLETVEYLHRMFMQTAKNNGRLGTSDPKRSNALERIVENLHDTVAFTFQK
jgi:hypothetical protein